MQQYPGISPPVWNYPPYPYYPYHGWPPTAQAYPTPSAEKKKKPKKEPIFKPQDLIIEEVELDRSGKQVKVSTHFYPSTGGPRIYSEGVSAEAFAQYRADMLDAVKRSEQLRELNQQSIVEFETQRQLKMQTDNERLRQQLQDEREYRKKDKLEYDVQVSLAYEQFK